MKRCNNLNNGYIGILMLLIGVAAVIFFIVRTDMFSDNKDSKNMIDQGQDAVGQAQDVKNLLEKNSRDAAVEQ